MRILYIEDSADLANNTKYQLEKMGFQVDVAYDGPTGEEKAYVNNYDVLLIDINLPGKNGIDVLDFLRKEGVSTPSIMVTANNGTNSKVTALDIGADDYISKPFDIDEMRARIQAVIRRVNGVSTKTIKIGDIAVVPSTRAITCFNKEISLSPKEYDIFEYMAMKHPKVVSTEEISEHVYDEYFDSFSSVLRVHIGRTKKKINDAIGYELITNIRGKGYKICLRK